MILNSVSVEHICVTNQGYNENSSNNYKYNQSYYYGQNPYDYKNQNPYESKVQNPYSYETTTPYNLCATPSVDHHHYGTYEVEAFQAHEIAEMQVLSNIVGSWGPISWDIDPQIDILNILNSKFHIIIKLLGSTIINIDISKDNSKLDLNVGILVAELGVDFNARRIYLKGYLNYIVNKVHFDLTLLKF